LLALFQVGAALNTLRRPPDLAAQVSLNPALEVVAGALWALLALVVLVRLLQGVPGAGGGAAWLLAACGVYAVIRLVMFTRAEYDQGRLPFLLAFSTVLIAIPVVLWARTRRASIHQSRSE
jgi:hypothetical protein